MMTRRCRTSRPSGPSVAWHNSQRRGLTLIEVLASLALLSVLLAGVLLTAGRARRQIEAAQRQQAAVEALDRLLEQHLPPLHGPLQADQGPVPGHDRWQWRLEPVPSVAAANLHAEVADIRIVDGRGRSLASVQTLVPLPWPPQESDAEDLPQDEATSTQEDEG